MFRKDTQSVSFGIPASLYSFRLNPYKSAAIEPVRDSIQSYFCSYYWLISFGTCQKAQASCKINGTLRKPDRWAWTDL
jgi:hypothetical protein